MILRLTLTNPKTIAAALSGVALTIGLGACGPSQTTPTATDTPAAPGASPAVAPGTPTPATPSRLDLAQNVLLSGAGASFPAPLYQRWFADFNKINPKARINYQSVGSGAGVQQFINKTVDFGASDVAMTDEELAKVQGGALMLPVTAGGIVLAYNVPGAEGLKLSRNLLADIFLGNIKTWNDPKIAEANPGVNLPNTPITVVYRADGSGTTGIFTKYLSAISPNWKSKVGDGKTVAWPTGVGSKGNEGVTAQIAQTTGSIGYIEYGYAKQNNLKFASLENKAGNYVTYNEQTASSALDSVQLPENLRAFIVDPEGTDSYPIISYTWLLVYPKYQDAAKAKTIEAVVEYALTEGQRIAPELGYIALPPKVASKVATVAQAISPDYNIAVAPPAGTPDTTAASPGATTPGAATPGATTTTPGATTPGATTTTPGATTPDTTTTPGATTPSPATTP
ncbi:phosphate ABC transporter substrate-binding protein PstS [Aerosakkonemataceae cyanobacterium BLCC-F50]|uniref:Phosphate ABC transporter substrate-binding protein PstS n=1 Tax=Floridaenema flaviceps BLCC-F50 TaxID=3153642 RepID=A0ABV4XWE7_9CYAN